jgi:hypothetical protein
VIMYYTHFSKGQNNWVCISDNNRDGENIQRGGGAVCVDNYQLALLLNRMTLAIDNCGNLEAYNQEIVCEKCYSYPILIFIFLTTGCWIAKLGFEYLFMLIEPSTFMPL